jgi:predicted NAD/FAD-binding protein
MKIAIIGGGASGMVTAYLLDRNEHHVTVFERQPILGGHIRTLNKNVPFDQLEPGLFLEAGVLEFPRKFHNFLALMEELGVELEPVEIGSALYLKDGKHFLSPEVIKKNFTGWRRIIEYLRLESLYARSLGLWLELRSPNVEALHKQSLSQFMKIPAIGNNWLKLLTMYSYSMPFELMDNFPAALAVPAMRDYVYVDWLRIKGGVYSYIEKILERFKGDVLLGVEVTEISRTPDSVTIRLSDGETQQFDKVVFATPPDQVMKLLSDPTPEETKRFSAWKGNQATTVIHTDTSMYAQHGIKHLSEFDFFQTNKGWGYNAYLNQLCGISSPLAYNLAFNLDDLIGKDKILHTQEHHTPFYTVEAFKYRDEVARTNGEQNTYHAGAYLGDGLHEGAITSAIRVAELIG